MILEDEKTPTAIAIIQARCSSTRLPGKVLLPLGDKPMIWHIVKRAESCILVNEVVVATSTEPSDDPLEDFCQESGISCFRGSLNNVLDRYLSVLRLHPHTYVVRITGDCPLIYPQFIDRQISLLSRFDADMVRLDQSCSLLEGQGVYSRRSLHDVAVNSTHPDDLEHVGSRYFATKPDKFKIIEIEVPSYLLESKFRVTVDEESDYQMLKALYQELYKDTPIEFHLAIEFLQSNLSISQINQHVGHSLVNRNLKNILDTTPSSPFIRVSWL